MICHKIKNRDTHLRQHVCTHPVVDRHKIHKYYRVKPELLRYKHKQKCKEKYKNKQMDTNK
jgi:hypothetical protein